MYYTSNMSFLVWFVFLVVIGRTDVIAQKIEITTESKILNSTPGKTITLPCFVTNVALAQAWVLGASWSKAQQPADLRLQAGKINNARHIVSPFDSTKFELFLQGSTVAGVRGTTLNLAIKNLSPEDSGIYSCSIFRHSRLNGTVAHNVTVLKEPSSLTLKGRTDRMAPESSNVNSSQPGSVILFREGTTGFIACVAVGVYPLPTMKIYIGKKDITQGSIPWRLTGPTLTGSTKYLQLMSYSVQRHSYLDPKFAYHMKELRCVLQHAITGANTTVTQMKVHVEYKPRLVSCRAVEWASPGKVNFRLKCSFKANPEATQVQWMAETTKEIIAVGQKKNGLSARISRVGFEEYEASLTIAKVAEKHYQSYWLQVNSTVGYITSQKQLRKGANGAGIRIAGTLWLAILPLLTLIFHQR